VFFFFFLALRSLLENLTKQYHDSAAGSSPTHEAVDTQSASTDANGRKPAEGPSISSPRSSRKRRKPNSGPRPAKAQAGGSSPNATQQGLQTPRQDFNPDMGRWSGLDSTEALPILEYTGPDFGLGNPQFSNLDDAEYLRLPVADDLYGDNPGAFGNIGWEAMANGAGYMNDWGSWSNGRF